MFTFGAPYEIIVRSGIAILNVAEFIVVKSTRECLAEEIETNVILCFPRLFLHLSSTLGCVSVLLARDFT